MKQRLLLISGMAHSGTTILQRAIKQHPHINGPVKESNFLVGKSNASITFELAQFSKNYADASIIVEKTPIHLWFYESLREVLPDAQMIVIIRDGKDVIASQSERFGRYYSITRGANHWTDSAYKALALSLRYPDQVKIIRYENFVQEYRSTMSEVFDFIDITDSDYDYGMIHEPSSAFYLSENIEEPDHVDLNQNLPNKIFSSEPSAIESTYQNSNAIKSSYKPDDEINIMPYRKLQVAAPLFDGSGKSKRLTKGDYQKLQSSLRFTSMMRFMGYSI